MFGLIVAGRLVSNTVEVLSLRDMSLFHCGTFLCFLSVSVLKLCWTVIAGPKALVSLILTMPLISVIISDM